MLRTISFVFALIFRFALGLALTLLLRNRAPEIFNLIFYVSIAVVAYIVIKRNNPYSIMWVIRRRCLEPDRGILTNVGRRGKNGLRLRSLPRNGSRGM